MYGIIDGNNFYVSCQRAFDDSLIGKHVVVLSNGDRCIVARSNEVKALGIKNGTPIESISKLVREHGIVSFSSNYELYGDMSHRMMSIIQSYVAESEIYSIDEIFTDMKGFELFGLRDYSSKIVQTVSQGTGIPVCMGIAPSKTLAKVANKFAKKYPKYANVCIIDSDDKRVKALKLFDISDVWGIGRKHTYRLQAIGVKTAFDFTQLSRAWVRKYMTVVGEKVWRELHGESCIDLELDIPSQKAVSVSRGLGNLTNDFAKIVEALTQYVSICAQRLRQQKSCASQIMVYLHTNNYKDESLRYAQNIVINLPVATNSTLELIKYAIQGLEQIYATSYKFSKVGVLMQNLVPENSVQMNLFDKVDRAKHRRLMEVVDKYSSGYNTNTLKLASQGGSDSGWQMQQNYLSPCYTTRLSDVLIVK